MTDIVLVEELRETRRRLAQQCGSDVQRYAVMLQELSRALPGVYVNQPLLPPPSPVPEELVRS
jgi:hypothetical protein